MAADLIGAGHADRVTFSHDETAYCCGAARLDDDAIERIMPKTSCDAARRPGDRTGNPPRS